MQDDRNRLLDLAQEQGLLAGHSTWVVRDGGVDGEELAGLTVLSGGPWAVVSRTRAHDLVLWGPGAPVEEAEWAPLMDVLEAKGLFVLHWVHPDANTLALYQSYLQRHVHPVQETFIFDWDPDIFGG